MSDEPEGGHPIQRWRAGNMVALAPLISDTPIIVLMVFVLGHLPTLFLHVLSFVGGVFVIYLGVETVRSLKAEVTVDKQVSSQHVLLPAVATNFLNPHPYLFWATVGGTLLVQSFAAGGIAASAAFVVSLYAFLVGAKLGIAFLLSRSQGWLKGRTYHAMLMGSGLLLIGLGLLLIWEGVQRFL